MKGRTAAEEQKCIEDFLKEYDDYDQALHVVASWREVFRMSEYERFHPGFDWFPETANPITGHSPLKPEFTAFLEPDYGLIGEVKASLPREQKGFDDDLAQLGSYCKIEALRDGKGADRKIQRRDVVLSLSKACNSDQIAKRILGCLNDPNHPFKPERNVIVMDHGFLHTHGRVQFQMHRIPIEGNGEFQQEILRKLMIEDLRSINMPVESTMEHISQHIIVNDTPKALFMMVLLWTQVFPAKFAATSRKSAPGRRLISVDAKTLLIELNEKFFGGQIRLPMSAIEDALAKFEAIGFASRSRKTGEFLVEYHQVMRVEASGQILRDYPECARFFATKLCRAKRRPSLGAPSSVIEQPSLFPEE